MEFRLVHLRPRKVRTQLFDHRRRSRYTRGSFRDLSSVLLRKSPATPRGTPLRPRRKQCHWQDYASDPATLWVKSHQRSGDDVMLMGARDGIQPPTTACSGMSDQ